MIAPTKSNQFETDSIYEAAALVATGHRPRQIRNTSSKYKIIVFDDSPKLRNSLSDFYNNPQLASFNGMGVNVLSIDENRVCIREEDVSIKKRLEKEGFETIPVKLRHCELMGGALHCTTLDVNRDEEYKSYF